MRGRRRSSDFWLLLLAPLLSSAGLPRRRSSTAGSFANWSAVVVAGDFHAHSGGPTEAFDNARRDVSRRPGRVGLRQGAIQQFSVRPNATPADAPGKAEGRPIYEALKKSRDGQAGCLFYISSHGGPDGVILGQGFCARPLLAAMMNDACPNRPSVVVISACFSGVFIPAAAEQDR
jgi:hypothetical protein